MMYLCCCSLLCFLEDQGIVAGGASANVICESCPGSFNLAADGLPLKLTYRQDSHGHTGGTYWMALGLQSAGRVDRQFAANFNQSFFNGLAPFAVRNQSHCFVSQDFTIVSSRGLANQVFYRYICQFIGF